MLEEFIYEDERCAIFIDGPSLYRACRSLDVEIDYGSLRSIFADAGYLMQARYYTTILDDQSYTPVRPLVDWLSYNGFVVVTKSVKAGEDFDEPWRLDRGLGMELAIDVVETSSKLDHVVLFTGNGDFLRLVKLMQRRMVRTTVVGTAHGSSSSTSDELRRQADTFVDLRALVPFVRKERHQASGVAAS
ncbi:MAG: NYN domain-containing protein [Geminicoccaceae bacterium]